MRELQARDIGLFSKIINKMELNDDMGDLFVTIDANGLSEEELKEAKNRANQEMGIKLMVMIAENYWKAEKEVTALLANLSGKTQKEVSELSLIEFGELLAKLKEDESIGSFFNLVTQ